MAVLRSIMPSSAIAMKAEYQENQLRIHITDVEAKPRSDLFVFLREGSNDQISLHFDKNQYITNLNLEPGKHIFAVKVGVEERSKSQVQSSERTNLASFDLPIIVPISVKVSSFTAILDGVSKVYSLPNDDKTVLKMKPTSFLSIDVNAQIPAEFVPTTTILQIESSNGLKYPLPMHLSESIFHAEVSPSRSDLASAFNYESGEFKLTFLCGDNLISSPLQIPLMTVTMNFAPRPKEIIYPLYSKPLMYATEMSTGPMKEIEHISRPENTNPFFLFPVAFSVVIMILLVGLGITWIRVGFYWKVGDVDFMVDV